MFERFSEEARQVVVFAQEEARDLRHSYIGTEHILLGLLREEEQRPDGEHPLRTFGITLVEARGHVARLVGPGEEASGGEASAGHQMPFTPRAKKALELALREALSLKQIWIGPEHILLGLVRETEGVAARVLLEFNLDSETVRREVATLVAGMPRRLRPQLVAGVRGRRVPMDAAWFDPLDDLLGALASEIRHALVREPDLGDLLLTIACARQTLAGAALDELGIDLDALWGTLERTRQERKEEGDARERRIAELREEKRQALQNERFQEAATLRDEERALTEQRRAPADEGVLREVRARLGLPTPEP